MLKYFYLVYYIGAFKRIVHRASHDPKLFLSRAETQSREKEHSGLLILSLVG